jgi:hypothetical protein
VQERSAHSGIFDPAIRAARRIVPLRADVRLKALKTVGNRLTKTKTWFKIARRFR